jgi:anti-anti-sigma factor
MICLADEEWDLTNCERLEELLAPALRHSNVVIDMTAVQFMDSSRLHKLVHMYQERVTRNGFSPARLVIPSPSIRRLFAIVLDQIWTVFGTLDKACGDASLSSDTA